MSDNYPVPVAEVVQRLQAGVAIPAHPLALDQQRRMDERRQRALTRYYLAAGAGGLAVGVHTTQFAIRDPKHALLRPVLELAAEECRRGEVEEGGASRPTILIAGVCGDSQQAIAEAKLARELGYHLGLLSLSGVPASDERGLLSHCRRVAEEIPLVGFYLQPSVGGRRLSYEFWRDFAEIPNVLAIKVAPFHRYQTLDVVRAVGESDRWQEIALYTGNDDAIVYDLLTPFRIAVGQQFRVLRFVGGLLGHWACWTRCAVELHRCCRRAVQAPASGSMEDLLGLAYQVTDMNAAIFDAANRFRGCIAGVHEVLRQQGLLAGTWCLDPGEELSPGQAAEIERVRRAYPHLVDDLFVAEHLQGWLS